MRSILVSAPVVLAALDAPGPGGACHDYAIQYGGPDAVCRVPFQCGPRGEPGSTPGIFDDALLAIVEDRLAAFQSGSFACDENRLAVIAVREARAAMAARVANRMARGVLGMNKT